MTDIRNTTEDMRDPANAALFLLGQLASANPGDPTNAIMAMEAQGQRELVQSDRLPTQVHSDGGDEAFLALGFTFGEPDPRDPLFRPATLPPGWKREPTDHSMWSRIVDELGRERVAIFYKAAFYDRKADMSLTTPYGYVRRELGDDRPLVLDDKWLTADVARATLEAMAARSDEEAARCDDFGRSQPDDEYWPGRAAEHRAEAAKARQWAEALS
jgi:hypothetical protein